MKTIYTIIFLFIFSLAAFAQTNYDRNTGIEFYRQGEYEKAVEILQESIKIENKDRLAWIYLGASFVKLNRKDDAVKAFRKADGVYKENLPVYDKKLNIKSRPKPPYTDEAKRNRTTGTIRLAIEFRADGKIGFIFPVQTLPDGLTEKAVEVTKDLKFEPAVMNGKAVTVVSFIEYAFTTF